MMARLRACAGAIHRLRTGAKLSLLMGLLLMAVLVVGAYGAWSVHHLRRINAEGLQHTRELMEALDAARSAEVAFKLQVQEFKNILLRGHDRAELDRHTAAFWKQSQLISAEFSKASVMMLRAGVPTASLDQARAMHTSIVLGYADALNLFDPARPESVRQADESVKAKDQPLESRIQAIVGSLQRRAEEESARANERATAQAWGTVAVLVAILVVFGGAAGWAGAALIRDLLRQLGGEPRYAKAVVRRVASGDLSVQVALRPGDRTSLLFAMNEMVLSLRGVLGQVASGAHTVADTSAQIAQGNADLSRRTELQAGTLEETASSMEELTATVTANADGARQVSEAAESAAQLARRGGQVVGQVVGTMGEISAASRRISDIIGVIDGIAFQTNILALNAAVEAARAGEQGRGFAVVATEVRNLAQRSAAAAKEVKQLIGDSSSRVEAGSRLVDQAGRTMQEIVDSAGKVRDLVAEIARASQEQSAGIRQVNDAMGQMDHVVQQNASLVEEASAATEAMKAQAAALLELVARFRLEEGEARPEPVLSAHPSAVAHEASRRLPRAARPAPRVPAGESGWVPL